jgi:uncharacterized protein with ParB-like and HNH nuclease domain
MALTLRAEPKTIYEIFSGKNQYTIPPYQRAYSWEVEQCTELLEDLKKAFEKKQNKDDDDGYFLGNIVTASSKEDKSSFEVIDGQQRLTTLTLLIKVLYTFEEDNNDLKEAIHIRGLRRQDDAKPRLKTNIYIDKDSILLDEVVSFKKNEIIDEYNKYLNLNQIKKNKYSIYHKNIFYFYEEILKLEEKYICDFIMFLMDEVTILPITSDAESLEKARENALMIFETINDRGLNISDADIIKTKFYTMSLNESGHKDFLKKWLELSEECENINYSIDDIFKIYMHIIRGQNRVSEYEVKLRVFFTREKHSALKDKKYDDLITDIFKIISVIKFFQNVIENPKNNNELTKWFQVIKEYSNQYPIISLFIYLYKNGFDNQKELIEFSKYLVKFSYSIYLISRGQIQFKIYKLIIDIMHDKLSNNYNSQITKEYFQNIGRLKNGYSLLAFYLQKNQEAIYPYYFDKIINIQDENNITDSWKDEEFTDYRNRLGNIFVIDKKTKKTTLNKRLDYIKESKLEETNNISLKLIDWTYEDFSNREEDLQNRLISFLGNEIEN